MKQVKSKITGDIGELDFDSKEGIFIVICYDLHTKATIKNYYKSLEDLYEGWEDYEEPKEYWRIDCDGTISQDKHDFDTPFDNACKEIGNYFETKEEAEKVVEKLKVWKRLKDRGFRFDGVNGCWIEFTLKSATSDEDFEQGQKDLHLLFGGKE